MRVSGSEEKKVQIVMRINKLRVQDLPDLATRRTELTRHRPNLTRRK
ncbi:hypothetical protein E2C01_037808 [Portunus trituberculatus]|uniref:Uncharacterized protein n=1 Tax=Portunus trituberculatus TaxID=210409 RepID=A0A5B7FI65_PORTR|nr:hypothetical protein [Portunus trituberculatus]